MLLHLVSSSVSSDTHLSTKPRLISLLIVLTLFLSFGAGCAAPEAENAVDSIVITRESNLYSPEKVSTTITDAQQVTQLLSLLKNLTYRQQQNPYDTADADTILTTDRITLCSGEDILAEYFLKGGLYIRKGDGLWHILTDESWQQMWELLHSHAPLANEQPPYGISLADSTRVTSVRIFRGQAYIELPEASQAEAFRTFMHSLQFCSPTDTLDAAPFQDGGALEHIQFLSGAAVVEEYYIYGQFVSPTPAGPSSILTTHSQSQLQQYLDSLF